MGIYGKQTRFSDDQDLTGLVAGTPIFSENDLKVGPGDFGQGNDLFLDVYMTEDLDEITSLQVALVTDSVLPIDGSSVVLYETAAIPLVELVAGYKFKIKSIPPLGEGNQYLGLRYTAVGATPSTQGKIFASLTDTTQDSNPSF